MADTAVDVRLAAKDFDSAVSDFVDRKPLWFGTAARWRSGLYPAVRASVTAASSRLGARHVGSRPPGRIDVIDWLCAVDREVTRWAGRTGGTVDALRELAGWSWTPDDVEVLVERTGQLHRWCIDAADLLGIGETRVPLRMNCPSCGARWARTGRGEDRRRIDALVVHGEAGVECRSCTAFWPPEHYGLLGGMLA